MRDSTASQRFTRRHACFLATLLLAMLVSAAKIEATDLQLSAGAAPDPRPNIIFLMTDDQRADTLSVSGNTDILTPNIDRLANDGVRYTNAFTVAPICAPSRFAFLSGQYERTSGLGFNSPYQVSDSQWATTYPAALRESGYFTGFIGKFGVQFYAFDHGAVSKFDYWKAHDGWLPFFPKLLPTNPATDIYKNAEHDITTEIMAEYIDDFLATAPKNRPFNLSVSFSAPHNSVVSSMYPEGAAPDCTNYACRVMGYPANKNPRLKDHPYYDGLYRDSHVSISPDTGKNPDRFIAAGVIDHKARQKWYAYNYDEKLQPEHQVRYYQTISGVDHVVGKLMEQLEALGIADNTIIIFSSDHGLLNGDYGTGGKALLYDLVTKIPLIVYDPRDLKTASAEVKNNLVLSIDVPPTILRYANIAPPETMQGRDLDTKAGDRDSVFLESLTVAEGNPFIEALRTLEWKYVRFLESEGCPYSEEHLSLTPKNIAFEQLFNLIDDPLERTNLAQEPKHQSLLQSFRDRTQQHSEYLTDASREYKQTEQVSFRPADGVYCW